MPGVPNYRDTQTPTPHRIPRSLENGKLDPGWIDAAGLLSALTLDDLANVSVPNPSDNDVLAYDSAQAQWIAVAATGGGSPNLDGGHADTEYGGTSAIDGGGA